MKRYLVRGGYDPRLHYDINDIFRKNIIGGNSGNMLYLKGVLNVLINEGISFDLTDYRYRWSDREAKIINETYDAFIIPLADAFRQEFMEELEGHTSLIQRLTIPCIVIGVGLRAPIGVDLSESYAFDDTVKRFIRTVLAHSARIGLRGEMTAAYLEKLGFRQSDFSVIGCPSLFSYGNSLTMSPVPEELHRIAYSFNRRIQSEVIGRRVVNYVEKVEKSFRILQNVSEFRRLYYQSQNSMTDLLPRAENGTDLCYCNAEDWIHFMASCDLAVGSRFHGTVAGILAGIPSVMIPLDARTKELTEYHKIPTISSEQILSGVPFEGLIAGIDVDGFNHCMHDNLERYCVFLKENGLENALESGWNLKPGTSYLDKQSPKPVEEASIVPYHLCGRMEKIKRKMRQGGDYVSRGVRKIAKNNLGI